MSLTSAIIKGGIKIGDAIAQMSGRQLNRLGSKLGMDKDILDGLSTNQIKGAILDESQKYMRNKRKNINRRVGAAAVAGAATYGVADFLHDLLGIKQSGKDSSFSREELAKLKQKKAQASTQKKTTEKTVKLSKDAMPTPKPKNLGKKKVFMKEKTGKDSKVEFKATTGSTGLLASKKDLKPIPAGKKGKGLSMLDKSVRNNMGFMYGGGMPMPSKKPRVSNTDYRKASKGMLIISIDMKKKKKGKGKKA